MLDEDAIEVNVVGLDKLADDESMVELVVDVDAVLVDVDELLVDVDVLSEDEAVLHNPYPA